MMFNEHIVELERWEMQSVKNSLGVLHDALFVEWVLTEEVQWC